MSDSRNKLADNSCEQQLKAVVADFFTSQVLFYQDMSHFVTVLSDAAMISSLKKKKQSVLKQFLLPYQQLLKYPRFFTIRPTNLYDDLQKIVDIIHWDNDYFTDIVNSVKEIVLQHQAFAALMSMITSRHAILFKRISNKLSHVDNLDAAYDPNIVSSIMIKPMQHLLRYDLFISRLLENLPPSTSDTRSEKIFQQLDDVKQFILKTSDKLNQIALPPVAPANKSNNHLFKAKSAPSNKPEELALAASVPPIHKSFSH